MTFLKFKLKKDSNSTNHVEATWVTIQLAVRDPDPHGVLIFVLYASRRFEWRGCRGEKLTGGSSAARGGERGPSVMSGACCSGSNDVRLPPRAS